MIAEPNQPLPMWRPGYLDLHHLSTGLGVASFFILPDGTTVLLDAGELDPTDPRTHSPRNTPSRPNASRPPHEWIAEYIAYMLPPRRQPSLDYAVISHFHDDHMGIITDRAARSECGDYRLSGITGVGELIPIRTLIDRGWPDYNYPVALDDPRVLAWLEHRPNMLKTYQKFCLTMKNYLQFIAWQREYNSMRVEQAQVGRADQIVLRHRPDDYDVQVRVVCANGQVWSGQGECAQAHIPPTSELPPGQLPDENLCSIGLLLRYGCFTYWNGGDIQGIIELDTPLWADIETPAARAVGAVDVHVLNHHGYRNTHNEFYVRTLRPRVMVQQVWSADQPGHGVLKRLTSTWLYPGPRDIFATDMLEAARLVIGELVDRAYTSQHGHVLVRVEPGGDRYWVIVLDDTDEAVPVKSVHGPFESGQKIRPPSK